MAGAAARVELCSWELGLRLLGCGLSRDGGADLGLSVPSAQKMPVTLALDNTRFLIRETEYMPWATALSSLNYFKLMFDRTEVYGPMKVPVQTEPSTLGRVAPAYLEG